MGTSACRLSILAQQRGLVKEKVPEKEKKGRGEEEESPGEGEERPGEEEERPGKERKGRGKERKGRGRRGKAGEGEERPGKGRKGRGKKRKGRRRRGKAGEGEERLGKDWERAKGVQGRVRGSAGNTGSCPPGAAPASAAGSEGGPRLEAQEGERSARGLARRRRSQ